MTKERQSGAKGILMMLVAIVFISCGSAIERKANELKAQGYCVVEKEDGLWYYNADSIFSYDAIKDIFNPLVPMHCSIVKHDKGGLSDMEGEIVKETDSRIIKNKET